MRRLLVVLLLALPLSAGTRVTLLHFSDYHSHALPFYTDEGMRGGIARAVHYLRGEKRHGALVFSGGDMVNKGAPAWSDKYGCAEWPWFNGIVDAMALGNHDPDYGSDALTRCRASVRYPLLSANTPGFKPYAVFETHGVRIGVFAIAGNDFQSLVKTTGFSFGDPIAAARDAVDALRQREHVDAVVMIGHEHAEADYELARRVPGIDLIFGTHTHLKRELTKIEGTNTWFISPWQYLAYISRVELTIDDHHVTAVEGRLVPVDASMREDCRVARRVRKMERALERDPKYRALFEPIGQLKEPLSIEAVATRTLEAMRKAAAADVALSTVSSFRQPLPAGTLTMELLRAALPYDNEIVVCTMNGGGVQRLLGESHARAGTDSTAFVAAPPEIDPAKQYRVATTDYLANVSYRDAFQCDKQKTGLHAREELRKTLGRR